MKYPLFIKWAITNECNLRCKHCYLGEYKNNIENYYIDMLIEDFRKNKVAYVTLTGGEPLINKDFQTIIRKLYNNGITTYIATNGTLLDIEKVNFLIANGIKVVQISLDGASKDINDRLRGKGTFDNVISNLQMMKRLGLKVIVAYTINKNNIDYINEFIDLKEFIQFDFLRFELYIPVINRFDELALSHDDINKIRYIFNSLKKDNSVILPKFNSEIMCGAGIVNCMINPDRTISPCDLLSCEIKSQMKIDAKHTLKDIWNNDPVLVQWRENMLKGLKVKGGCRASALKYNNNMISEDPLLLLYGNENDD